jgi:hypothetical protein
MAMDGVVGRTVDQRREWDLLSDKTPERSPRHIHRDANRTYHDIQHVADMLHVHALRLKRHEELQQLRLERYQASVAGTTSLDHLSTMAGIVQSQAADIGEGTNSGGSGNNFAILGKDSGSSNSASNKEESTVASTVNPTQRASPTSPKFGVERTPSENSLIGEPRAPSDHSHSSLPEVRPDDNSSTKHDDIQIENLASASMHQPDAYSQNNTTQSLSSRDTSSIESGVNGPIIGYKASGIPIRAESSEPMRAEERTEVAAAGRTNSRKGITHKQQLFDPIAGVWFDPEERTENYTLSSNKTFKQPASSVYHPGQSNFSSNANQISQAGGQQPSQYPIPVAYSQPQPPAVQGDRQQQQAQWGNNSSPSFGNNNWEKDSEDAQSEASRDSSPENSRYSPYAHTQSYIGDGAVGMTVENQSMQSSHNGQAHNKGSQDFADYVASKAQKYVENGNTTCGTRSTCASSEDDCREGATSWGKKLLSQMRSNFGRNPKASTKARVWAE